jgi:mannose-6-phosphate isomerase
MENQLDQIGTKPWGSYQILVTKEGYQVKLLTISAGGKLSLQKHDLRHEHWVVVKGHPVITINNRVRAMKVGDKISIPCGAKHRLENLTDDPVVVIEVQIGKYLGEDDIVRFEDIYGREIISEAVK